MRLRLRQPIPAVGSRGLAACGLASKCLCSVCVVLPPNTVYDSGQDGATAALRRRSPLRRDGDGNG
jgi:hypothetical protein